MAVHLKKTNVQSNGSSSEENQLQYTVIWQFITGKPITVYSHMAVHLRKPNVQSYCSLSEENQRAVI